MRILAIDPGPEESGYLVYDGAIQECGKTPNQSLMALVRQAGFDRLVIEQIRGFGITAGNSVFDTCVWSGRFCEAFGADRTDWIPRKTVVTHLCGTVKAGDTDVHRAIAYRFGFHDLHKAKGTKKEPGPLYGIAKDTWSALAVALTWWDQQKAGLHA